MIAVEHAATETATAKAELFCEFCDALEQANIPYCILSGYQHYPQHIASDVDFMVPAEAGARLYGVITGLAARTGSMLVQVLEHETTARYSVLAQPGRTEITFIALDSSTDYRRGGRFLLSASDILARRRRHPAGFYIPAPEDSFLYYAIKRIEKGVVREEQFAHLRARWAEAPVACAKSLRRFWPKHSSTLIDTAVAQDNLATLQNALPQLRCELLSQRIEPINRRITHWLQDFRRKVRRVLKPQGMLVAVLGPDGSGKSTVINCCLDALLPAFRLTATVHLRPHLLERRGNGELVSDPHGNQPRSRAASAVKLLYWWFDYVAGYFVSIRPRLVRSTLVVFDRYYHDILVDRLRYRFSGPLWLAKLVSKMIPEPEMWVVLDVPAEELMRRKGEVTLDEAIRQRHSYLALARQLRNVVVIDGSQPVERVVANINEAVLLYMAGRTSRRYGSVAHCESC